ncbi:MAG: hypothetical protein R3F48_11135 [Candidatus Zixiibacteriota bacterium]
MRIIFILITIVGALVLGSCTQENGISVAHDAYFVYNSAYLGNGIELTACDKWFRLPKGYSPAPDSILQMLQASLNNFKDRMFEIEMTHCFLDTMTQSGILVTQIKDFTLGSDTTAFFENYSQVLDNLYGHAGVIDGSEVVNDSVLIRYFIVTDRRIARFQAICLTNRFDGVELNFFMPDSLYQSKLAIIRSSLSTLKALPRPDGCQ